MSRYDYSSGMYWIEIRHEGLHKCKLIRGRDQHAVEEKAAAQRKAWDAQWDRFIKQEEKKGHKVALQKRLQKKTAIAQKRTDTAQLELDILENLLMAALRQSPVPDFKNLLKQEKFESKSFEREKPELRTVKKPRLTALPLAPVDPIIPEMPKKDSHKYIPLFTLRDKLFKSQRTKTIEAVRETFQSDLKAWTSARDVILSNHKKAVEKWEKSKADIETQNAAAMQAYEQKCIEAKADYDAKIAIWEQEKIRFEETQSEAAQRFENSQQENNNRVKRIERLYLRGSAEGVIEYCRLVLAQSGYPEYFPREFALDYNADNSILVVEYVLPTVDKLPTLTEVSYKKSADQFKETFLSDSALNALYDRVLYQITLRTLYELFKADKPNNIASIVFNGWVRSYNKATGKKANTCILSIHAKRESFKELDLRNVEPKACFRLLKGVGSSELSGIVAIAPIMRIDKTDKRFVQAYDVADGLDDSINIAAMDWEDFEHLVRELFEKEFSQYGGDVKITQASRDGGVDAVAFDPDPIRGGKIVIQAKRYTNVVGLSAVRDLYGTVVNEGATKGILVTTAAYGPDAYEFAKDKPLTLLNGANLLHLLERHGHKARIDLNEAKKVLSEEKRK